MPYATIRGLRLFYKDVGTGPPLVLIPGLGADSTAYNPLLPQLRKRVRAIVPDPLGLGRSGDAPEPLTLNGSAEDIFWLLDHLDIPRASVLGTSIGAMVARRFTTLYPHRVECLILCSPGGARSPYGKRIRRLLRALLEGTSSEDFLGHFFTLMLSPEFIDEQEERLLELEQAARLDGRTLKTMLRQLAMMDLEVEEEMGEVRKPVLIITGGQDRLVPLKYVQVLNRSMPGSRLLVLEKAAHHVFLEAPEEALAGLFAFLAHIL